MTTPTPITPKPAQTRPHLPPLKIRETNPPPLDSSLCDLPLSAFISLMCQSAPNDAKARHFQIEPKCHSGTPRRASAKRTHRTFITLLALLFLALPAAAQNKPTAQNKPNLILILCDDLGYGDLACYGNPTIKTPNLDRLANEGIRFTDFYCAGAQCTPSRAGLLTGRYPVRFGLTYTLMTNAGAGLPATETTFPQLLQKQGYATMLAGKWHLGDRPQFHPLRHGFNNFAGLLRGHDTDPREFYRDNKIIDKEAPLETLTHRYTTDAANFITDQSKRGRPFFLMLSHTYPHTPLTGTYQQAVEEIDASTSQILAALKANHIEDNTLIFFTSDNGPSVDKGKEGGSPGPFKAGKFSTYEGGLRIPAIAWYPAKIKPRVESQPAILLDLFPTFLQIAGGKPPPKPTIDGQDLSAVLFENGKRNNSNFYFYMQEKLQAHRSQNWKLKLPDKPGEPLELYDLNKDPGEATNVANEHADIVKRLREEMGRFEKSIKSE